METLNLDTLIWWLRNRAGGLYGGEQVTQLEHALQCAALAEAEGATPELVVAALLHDIGHLSDNPDDRQHPHSELGARLLGGMFSPAVTEPVRLHVAAKRYLCVEDPMYWSRLSVQSKRSLEWQGGPFTVAEANDYINQPHAEDAVRLRQWDDRAKTPGKPTPSLDHFIATMRSLSIRAGVPA
jgi:phosphonate degradation associated HDIG domain protein